MTSLVSGKAELKPGFNLAFQIKQSALIKQKEAALQEFTDLYEEGGLSDQEAAQRLIDIASSASDEENKLRQSFQVDDKPSFIATQLENLARKIKDNLKFVVSKTLADAGADKGALAPDELMVYVHLFHSQGQTMRSWRALLSPDIFRECSINRPVYLEQSHVNNLMAANKDKLNHACVVVKIKKSEVKEGDVRDEYNQPLLKLKAGALDPKNIVSFIHDERPYKLTPEGEFVRQSLS